MGMNWRIGHFCSVGAHFPEAFPDSEAPVRMRIRSCELFLKEVRRWKKTCHRGMLCRYVCTVLVRVILYTLVYPIHVMRFTLLHVRTSNTMDCVGHDHEMSDLAQTLSHSAACGDELVTSRPLLHAHNTVPGK